MFTCRAGLYWSDQIWILNFTLNFPLRLCSYFIHTEQILDVHISLNQWIWYTVLLGTHGAIPQNLIFAYVSMSVSLYSWNNCFRSQIPGWSCLSNARVTIFGDIEPLPERLKVCSLWCHNPLFLLLGIIHNLDEYLTGIYWKLCNCQNIRIRY